MADIATSHHQGGWAGIVGLLLALLVIAIVALKMLREYGLTAQAVNNGAASQKSAARPVDSLKNTGVDATAATVVPSAAIERARGLEATIQQQADQTAKRIDEQTR